MFASRVVVGLPAVDDPRAAAPSSIRPHACRDVIAAPPANLCCPACSNPERYAGNAAAEPRRSRVLKSTFALAICGWLLVTAYASAQTSLATYQGADRMQRIIEGAKKEGEVSIYTSAPTDDMKAMGDAFEKKY